MSDEEEGKPMGDDWMGPVFCCAGRNLVFYFRELEQGAIHLAE